MKEIDRNQAGQQADKSRDCHQPQFVLGGQAVQNAIHFATLL
jgi:hypothetical protein